MVVHRTRFGHDGGASCRPHGRNALASATSSARTHDKAGLCPDGPGVCSLADPLQPSTSSVFEVRRSSHTLRCRVTTILINAHPARVDKPTERREKMPTVRKRRSRKNSRINNTRYGRRLKKRSCKSVKNRIQL